MKVYKNVSWYGADDWDPYIIRGGYLVRDLYYQEPNCFTAQPVARKWTAGSSFDLSIKCTLLLFKL